MKIIGLTGSIAMGKSETLKMFAARNIPVFDSDAAVHKLLEKNGAAVEQVTRRFPDAIAGGKIDRKRLGQNVFEDEDALRALEGILHPMVKNLRDKFLVDARNNNQTIVVFDIPLLFEKGYEKECDFIVVVSAAADVQRKRALERPDMTEDRFLSILSNQMPDEEKRRRADFIIQTDKGIDYAEKQVTYILKKVGEADCAK